MELKFFLHVTIIKLLIVLIGMINCVVLESNLIVIKQNDPKDNIRGETFDCLNFMFQMRTGEQNLLQGDYRCSQYCSIYNRIQQYRNEDYLYNYNEYCSGQLRDCILYRNPEKSNTEVASKFFISAITFPFAPKTEERRKENKKLLQSACPVCKCHCDNSQNPALVSSFCLDTLMSNVTEGYVVNGVQFKIINTVVTVQIQQGKLTNGVIDKSTIQWKQHDKCNKIAKMNYDFRSMQIDDVITSSGSVVIGVSLGKDNVTKRIYLSILGKPTNELKNDNVNATEYYQPAGTRTELINFKMNTPGSCVNNTELSVTNKNYITFQIRHLSNDDDEIDDRLMPYLDTRQLVTGDYVKPLRGVGIFWRGQQNCGGYLAFKLFVENNHLK